ncbi:MAG: ParB N-terminal domain-containing protein [Euryhalocaulis sp.]|nr:ParB N-terminal domain-containing protein [Euryhalocaulis sp.]
MSSRDRAAMALKVRYVAPETLTPYAGNARTHSEKQIDKIARSIEQFGFVNPILTDADGNVIAGHGRIRAAIKLGLKEAPVILLAHLSEAERRAYILADNRLAEDAGWDSDLLRIELGYLCQLDLEIDPTITGFEVAEIDLALSLDVEPEQETCPTAITSGEAVTRQGEIWTCGVRKVGASVSWPASVSPRLQNPRR